MCLWDMLSALSGVPSGSSTENTQKRPQSAFLVTAAGGIAAVERRSSQQDRYSSLVTAATAFARTGVNTTAPSGGTVSGSR